MDPTLDGAFQNITNTTRDANVTNPFTLSNQTDLLAHVISASGGITYSWSLFFGIAVALVAGSSILPIITGPILRLALQSMVKYRPYWRLIYPTMLAIYIAGAYIMAPFVSVLAHFILQLLLPTVVLVSIFQRRGLFRWFRGRQGKRERRSIVRRLLFVVISLACTLVSVSHVFSYLHYVGFIIGCIPLFILLWVEAGGSIKRWCARKWSTMRRHQP